MTLQGASIRDAIGAVIPWGLSRIMPYRGILSVMAPSLLYFSPTSYEAAHTVSKSWWTTLSVWTMEEGGGKERRDITTLRDDEDCS